MEKSDSKFNKLSKWNNVKYSTHIKQRVPWIHNGEVWWCRVGENIGNEMNGKHENSLRPVYIFKKTSPYGAIVIPLTSKDKTGSWYYKFYLNNQYETLNFSQIKAISVYRLENRLGVVDSSIKREIKDKLLKFLR